MFDYETLVYGVALLAAFAMAYFSGEIASKKGHSFAAFAVLGLLLPVIGIIIAAALPDAGMRQAVIDAARQDATQSVADELLKYKRLLDDGAITQEEYDALKARAMDGRKVVDEDNPITVRMHHSKGGQVTVVVEDGGRTRQYGHVYKNELGIDPHDFCAEVAERIEVETGRKVMWYMR